MQLKHALQVHRGHGVLDVCCLPVTTAAVAIMVLKHVRHTQSTADIWYVHDHERTLAAHLNSRHPVILQRFKVAFMPTMAQHCTQWHGNCGTAIAAQQAAGDTIAPSHYHW